MTKRYKSSGRDSSSSDSDYSLYSDSEWYELSYTDEIKDMKILYHAVTDNIKNKNQCNDTI